MDPIDNGVQGLLATMREECKEKRASLSPVSDLAGTTEEEVEDPKIEKFYALVERMQETRDLWNRARQPSKRIRRMETSLWKPAFEWEDFALGTSERGGDEGEGKRRSGSKASEEEESVSKQTCSWCSKENLKEVEEMLALEKKGEVGYNDEKMQIRVCAGKDEDKGKV
ncbi:hypothetical protein HPP92_022834 [Vanilla planifolia]|uniref:Uncharacterized protein n=1 Tax=Vanilla planifolia TaxID=51239 RepID=A0A835PWF2_VANPL|nr:hypothetical protein HPP92_022834 [Vanilla planifolia]